MNPDPVRNLGPWSFTLQPETPVHWVRTGPLESYLLKTNLEIPLVPGSLISTGILLHSGEDILGGVAIWLEIKDNKKVYCLGGNDLGSKPVVTTPYNITSQNSMVKNARKILTETWEFLIQGNTGCAFFGEKRNVRIRFSIKRNKGSCAFFNSSKSPPWDHPDLIDSIYPGNLDVVYNNVRITAVSKKVELDSYLTSPGIGTIHPKILEKEKQEAQKLWNASEAARANDPNARTKGSKKKERFISQVLIEEERKKKEQEELMRLKGLEVAADEGGGDSSGNGNGATTSTSNDKSGKQQYQQQGGSGSQVRSDSAAKKIMEKKKVDEFLTEFNIDVATQNMRGLNLELSGPPGSASSTGQNLGGIPLPSGLPGTKNSTNSASGSPIIRPTALQALANTSTNFIAGNEPNTVLLPDSEGNLVQVHTNPETRKLANELAQKHSSHIDFFAQQEKLASQLGGSVMFNSAPRACPYSEYELQQQRRQYNDPYYQINRKLVGQPYQFGERPQRSGIQGQHFRDYLRITGDPQDEYGAFSSEPGVDNNMGQDNINNYHSDSELMNTTQWQQRQIGGAINPISGKRRQFQMTKAVSQKSLQKWKETLHELRSQPAYVQIPKDELNRMKSRVKAQLEGCTKRLQKCREEINGLALKRAGLPLDDEESRNHPATVQAKQHIEMLSMKLEHDQLKLQSEELSYISRIRIIDEELYDLGFERPGVKELLPQSLREVLERDEMQTGQNRNKTKPSPEEVARLEEERRILANKYGAELEEEKRILAKKREEMEEKEKKRMAQNLADNGEGGKGAGKGGVGKKKIKKKT